MEEEAEVTDEHRGPAHWIVVGSPENIRRTAEIGFTLQGTKSRHRKKAERMAPGDKIDYYLTGIKGFDAIATIQSAFVDSHEPIWTSADPKKAAEDYPFRVRISPDLVLPESAPSAAEPAARRMPCGATWANWTLAFQGNVHAIGADDSRLIREAMAESVPDGSGQDGRRVA